MVMGSNSGRISAYCLEFYMLESVIVISCELLQFIKVHCYALVCMLYPLLYRLCDTLLVAQLVEALRYKPEGRGFVWCL